MEFLKKDNESQAMGGGWGRGKIEIYIKLLNGGNIFLNKIVKEIL